MRSSRSRSEEEEEEEDLADLRERCEALTFLVLGEDLAKAAEWRSGFGRVYALERRLADETTDESVRALARDLDETEAAIEAALAAALEIPSTGKRPREGDGPPGLWQGTVDRPRCPRPSWSKAILTHHADENYYRALGAADEDGDDEDNEAGDLVGPPVDEAVGFRRPSAPPVAKKKIRRARKALDAPRAERAPDDRGKKAQEELLESRAAYARAVEVNAASAAPRSRCAYMSGVWRTCSSGTRGALTSPVSSCSSPPVLVGAVKSCCEAMARVSRAMVASDEVAREELHRLIDAVSRDTCSATHPADRAKTKIRIGELEARLEPLGWAATGALVQLQRLKANLARWPKSMAKSRDKRKKLERRRAAKERTLDELGAAREKLDAVAKAVAAVAPNALTNDELLDRLDSVDDYLRGDVFAVPPAVKKARQALGDYAAEIRRKIKSRSTLVHGLSPRPLPSGRAPDRDDDCLLWALNDGGGARQAKSVRKLRRRLQRLLDAQPETLVSGASLGELRRRAAERDEASARYLGLAEIAAWTVLRRRAVVLCQKTDDTGVFVARLIVGDRAAPRSFVLYDERRRHYGRLIGDAKIEDERWLFDNLAERRCTEAYLGGASDPQEVQLTAIPTLAETPVELLTLTGAARVLDNREAVSQLEVVACLLETFPEGYVIGGMARYLAQLEFARRNGETLPLYHKGDVDFHRPGLSTGEMLSRLTSAVSSKTEWRLRSTSRGPQLEDVWLTIGATQVQVQLVDASKIRANRPLIFRSDGLAFNGRFFLGPEARKYDLYDLLGDAIKNDYRLVADRGAMARHGAYGKRVYARVAKKLKTIGVSVLYDTLKWDEPAESKWIADVRRAVGESNLEDLRGERRRRLEKKKDYRSFETLVKAVACAAWEEAGVLQERLLQAGADMGSMTTTELAYAIAKTERRHLIVHLADGTVVNAEPNSSDVPLGTIEITELEKEEGTSFELGASPESLEDMLLGDDEATDEKPVFGFRSTSFSVEESLERGAHVARDPTGTLSVAAHVVSYDRVGGSPFLSLSKYLGMTVHWTQHQYWARSLQTFANTGELYRGPKVGPVQCLLVVNLPHYESLMRKGLGVKDDFVFRADVDGHARANGITGSSPLWSVTHGELDAHLCVPVEAIEAVFVIDPDDDSGKKVLDLTTAPEAKTERFWRARFITGRFPVLQEELRRQPEKVKALVAALEGCRLKNWNARRLERKRSLEKTLSEALGTKLYESYTKKNQHERGRGVVVIDFDGCLLESGSSSPQPTFGGHEKVARIWRLFKRLKAEKMAIGLVSRSLSPQTLRGMLCAKGLQTYVDETYLRLFETSFEATIAKAIAATPRKVEFERREILVVTPTPIDGGAAWTSMDEDMSPVTEWIDALKNTSGGAATPPASRPEIGDDDVDELGESPTTGDGPRKVRRTVPPEEHHYRFKSQARHTAKLKNPPTTFTIDHHGVVLDLSRAFGQVARKVTTEVTDTMQEGHLVLELLNDESQRFDPTNQSSLQSVLGYISTTRNAESAWAMLFDKVGGENNGLEKVLKSLKEARDDARVGNRRHIDLGAKFWHNHTSSVIAEIRTTVRRNHGKEVDSLVDIAVALPPLFLLAGGAVDEGDLRALFTSPANSLKKTHFSEFPGLGVDDIEGGIEAIKKGATPPGEYDGSKADVDLAHVGARAKHYVRRVRDRLYDVPRIFGDELRLAKVSPGHLLVAAVMLRGVGAPFVDKTQGDETLKGACGNIAPATKAEAEKTRAAGGDRLKLQRKGMAVARDRKRRILTLIERVAFKNKDVQPISKTILARTRSVRPAGPMTNGHRLRFWNCSKTLFSSMIPKVVDEAVGGMDAATMKESVGKGKPFKTTAALKKDFVRVARERLEDKEAGDLNFLRMMGWDAESAKAVLRSKSRCARCGQSSPDCRRIVDTVQVLNDRRHVVFFRTCTKTRVDQVKKKPRIWGSGVDCDGLRAKRRSPGALNEAVFAMRKVVRDFGSLCNVKDYNAKRVHMADDVLRGIARFTRVASTRKTSRVKALVGGDIITYLERAFDVVHKKYGEEAANRSLGVEAGGFEALFDDWEVDTDVVMETSDVAEEEKTSAVDRGKRNARKKIRRLTARLNREAATEDPLKSDVAKDINERYVQLRPLVEDSDDDVDVTIIEELEAAREALSKKKKDQDRDVVMRPASAHSTAPAKLIGDSDAAKSARRRARKKIEKITRRLRRAVNSKEPIEGDAADGLRRGIAWGKARLSEDSVDDLKTQKQRFEAVCAAFDKKSQTEATSSTYEVYDLKNLRFTAETTTMTAKERLMRWNTNITFKAPTGVAPKKKRKKKKPKNDDDEEKKKKKKPTPAQEEEALFGTGSSVSFATTTEPTTSAHRLSKTVDCLRDIEANATDKDLRQHATDLKAKCQQSIAAAARYQDDGGEPPLDFARFLEEYERYLTALCGLLAEAARRGTNVKDAAVDRLGEQFLSSIRKWKKQLADRIVALDMGETSLFVGAIANFGLYDDIDALHERRLQELKAAAKQRNSKKNAHRLRYQSPKFIDLNVANYRHVTGINRNVSLANRRWHGREIFVPSKPDLDRDARYKEELAFRLQHRAEVRELENTGDLDAQREQARRRRRSVLESAAARVTDSRPTIVIVGSWGLKQVGPNAASHQAPAGAFLEILMRDPNALVVFLGEQYTSQRDPFTTTAEDKTKLMTGVKKNKDGEDIIWGLKQTAEGHIRRRDEAGALNLLAKAEAILEVNDEKRQDMYAAAARLFANYL